MDQETRKQIARASLGSVLLSDCLAAPASAIKLTDEMRASFADLCAAFDLLNDRLEKQRLAGRLGAEFGKRGGRPRKRENNAN